MQMTSALVTDWRGRVEHNMRTAGLSPRERELAWSPVEGRGTEEIAVELRIAPHTVKNHMTALYTKLGCSCGQGTSNRTQTVLLLLGMRRPGDGAHDE